MEVNLVSILRGLTSKGAMLDGQAVNLISSHLDREQENEPKRLRENQGKSFQGSIPLGKGFIVETEYALELIARQPRNRDCLVPYLTGEDVYTRPDQSPSRYIIHFDERSEMEAQTYPDLWSIVQQNVWPERRDKDSRKYPRMVHEWWKFWNNRRELHLAIKSMDRVLVRSRVGEMHAVAFVPTHVVFSDATVVLAFNDYYNFAVLQSSLHDLWVRRNASTMRTDIRYTSTDCFETYPFPDQPSANQCVEAERAGQDYEEHRRQIMTGHNIGLTKTYNLVHNPECNDQDILRLRQLHIAMDNSVLSCYGWGDIDLAHEFHQNDRQQIRFTISDAARHEILRRLLILNLKLYEFDK